jgi:hypothetical protein
VILVLLNLFRIPKFFLIKCKCSDKAQLSDLTVCGLNTFYKIAFPLRLCP